MTRLQQLVNNPPALQYVADTTNDNTVDKAHAETTTDSEGLLPTTLNARGRTREGTTIRARKASRHSRRSPSSFKSRLPSPPPRRSRNARRKKKTHAKAKKETRDSSESSVERTLQTANIIRNTVATGSRTRRSRKARTPSATLTKNTKVGSLDGSVRRLGWITKRVQTASSDMIRDRAQREASGG